MEREKFEAIGAEFWTKMAAACHVHEVKDHQNSQSYHAYQDQ